MAKAKKTTRKTKTFTAAKLPAGFTVTGVPGSGGSFVNWEQSPIVQGKVTDTFKRKGEYGVQRYLTVKQKNGIEVSFSESFALAGLFNQAKKGSEIYVQYHGTVPGKGKKTFKQFTSGIK